MDLISQKLEGHTKTLFDTRNSFTSGGNTLFNQFSTNFKNVHFNSRAFEKVSIEIDRPKTERFEKSTESEIKGKFNEKMNKIDRVRLQKYKNSVPLLPDLRSHSVPRYGSQPRKTLEVSVVNIKNNLEKSSFMGSQRRSVLSKRKPMIKINIQKLIKKKY